MRQSHKDAFFHAAEQFTCWIGLREPNPLADKWIGKPHCIPKDEHCKAKTSDNSSYEFAGLVADPNTCPNAFKTSTRAEALWAWTKFAPGGRLPTGYVVVNHGKETGLVKLRGSMIHADFDLMSLLKSNDDGEFLTTSQPEQKSLYDKVKPVLNRKLGAPMIQHGAEFMWTGGVGARESEYVLWFGPGRRMNRWPSSMPRGGH